MIIVGGGSISMIEFSRDNAIYDSFGLLSGDFFLNPGDWIRISYTLAPTAVYQIAAAGGTGVGEPVPGLSLECPPQAPQRPSRARRVTNW